MALAELAAVPVNREPRAEARFFRFSTEQWITTASYGDDAIADPNIPFLGRPVTERDDPPGVLMPGDTWALDISA